MTQILLRITDLFNSSHELITLCIMLPRLGNQLAQSLYGEWGTEVYKKLTDYDDNKYISIQKHNKNKSEKVVKFMQLSHLIIALL